MKIAFRNIFTGARLDRWNRAYTQRLDERRHRAAQDAAWAQRREIAADYALRKAGAGRCSLVPNSSGTLDSYSVKV